MYDGSNTYLMRDKNTSFEHGDIINLHDSKKVF